MLIFHIVARTFREGISGLDWQIGVRDRSVFRGQVKMTGTKFFMDKFQMLDFRNFEWYGLKSRSG